MVFTFNYLMSRATTLHSEIKRLLVSGRNQKMFCIQENTVQEGESKGAIQIHGNSNVFQFLNVLQIHLTVIFIVPSQNYHFSIRMRSACMFCTLADNLLKSHDAWVQLSLKSLEGLNTSPMKKGQESWDGSARRRKGSGENLIVACRYTKGAYGKDGETFTKACSARTHGNSFKLRVGLNWM